MLYSQSLHEDKFNLFALFLRRILDGDTGYCKTVNKVIEEAHRYAIDKNLFELSREDFPIVTFLVGKAEEYFKTIEPKNLKGDDYNEILAIIEG